MQWLLIFIERTPALFKPANQALREVCVTAAALTIICGVTIARREKSLNVVIQLLLILVTWVILLLHLLLLLKLLVVVPLDHLLNSLPFLLLEHVGLLHLEPPDLFFLRSI